MTPSANYWPQVAPLLQSAYHERLRAWIEEASKLYPNIQPWPVRRSRRRKPIPGLIEALEPEG